MAKHTWQKTRIVNEKQISVPTGKGTKKVRVRIWDRRKSRKH